MKSSQFTLSTLAVSVVAGAVNVKVPSPQSFLDDPCAAFRLPPRAVNATFLDEIDVEHVWVEPPFAFGYGKWALAWTTIEEYWTWLNMQNEWYPIESKVRGASVNDVKALVIADINSFQLGDNDTVITTPATDVPLRGESYAWNYTIPADIMFDTDNTCWVGWGYDMYEQGAPYFLSYDASTTGVKNVSYGLSIYSARERGPSDKTVKEIGECYEKLGSPAFLSLARGMQRTPTDGRRSNILSWRAPYWRDMVPAQSEQNPLHA